MKSKQTGLSMETTTEEFIIPIARPGPVIAIKVILELKVLSIIIIA